MIATIISISSFLLLVTVVMTTFIYFHEPLHRHSLCSRVTYQLPHTFTWGQEDMVLCRVFQKSRSATSDPTKAPPGNGEAAASSSLPPPMDSFAAFEQQPPASSEVHKQVSAFSDLAPHCGANDGAINPRFMVQRSLQIKNSGSSVLSYSTELEGNPKREVPPSPCMAARSSGSYFTENGLSYVRNPFGAFYATS